MSRLRRRLRESLLPLGVFAAVAAGHFLWVGLLPEQDPAQARWAALPSEGGAAWLPRYLEMQGYWLGYSYGLSLAFAATAFRRHVRHRGSSTGAFAIGGVTFSGLLAVAGCYGIGCCGSPMLVVWLSLFGVKFLPFARPLLAALTTLSIAAAWWWMGRTEAAAVLAGRVGAEASR